MIKFILLASVIAILVLGTLAVRHLDWWLLALIFLGLIIVGKFVIKYVLRRIFLIPFTMKGATLRNAYCEVHSVTPTTAPPPEPEEQSVDDDGEPDDADEDDEDEDQDDDTDSEVDDEEQVPRNYYLLDVSITPRQTNCRFMLWEPGELLLTRTDFKINLPQFDDDDACAIEDVKVFQDGAFAEDEVGKYEGPQRLQMLLAVREGVPALKFQYYLEQFGQVELPVSTPAAPAPPGQDVGNS
jgi:hypothetical protein